MCLLIYSWQPGTEFPLVVAANRDEWLERPAECFGVLGEAEPRVLGGRDLLAGGTWLAVNEHGVIAGLTNRPTAGGRDDSKRSRGELPLIAARQMDAEAAVAALMAAVGPGDFNPAAMLIADRASLFAVELAADQPLVVTQLDPGLHVLENVPYGQPSAKVDLVTSALAGGRNPWRDARAVVADHTITAASDPRTGDAAEAAGAVVAAAGGDTAGVGAGAVVAAVIGAVVGDTRPADGESTSSGLRVLADGTVVRPLGTSACCVHLEEYGTRSSALIRVPAAGDRPIEIAAADGPPCITPFEDRTGLWVSPVAS